MEKKQYDSQKKRQAGIHSMLRCLVSAYLIYLAVKIARGAGSDSMPVWCAWGIAAAFAVVAVGFIVYALRQYRKDLLAAQPPENSEKDEQES